MSKTKWRVNYKNLQEFTDIAKAKERLEKLDASRLGEKEKFAVDNFLETRKVSI